MNVANHAPGTALRVLLENALLRTADATVFGASAAVPMSLSLGSGVHALVGTPLDGTHCVAPLLSGVARPRTGRVVVDGRDPGRDRDARARVGTTFEVPALAPTNLVRDLFRLAGAFRRWDPGVVERLGLAALAD